MNHLFAILFTAFLSLSSDFAKTSRFLSSMGNFSVIKCLLLLRSILVNILAISHYISSIPHHRALIQFQGLTDGELLELQHEFLHRAFALLIFTLIFHKKFIWNWNFPIVIYNKVYVKY